MTVNEAQRIRREFYNITNPKEDDFFRYTEALKFLIEETKDPDYMVELGGMYYEQRHFELALKYYELAAEYNNRWAISNLGYIWYYGRTGEKNYEKAFAYFDKARQMGDLIAAYKVADMYKNGYYVEKDPERYKAIIEELYPKVKDSYRLDAPLPEVLTRLAAIRAEEGRTDEALQLYDEAREFQERRIRAHPFFGDLNIMKWMIRDIYRLRPLDPQAVGLYDLYEILQAPAKVRFLFEEQPHEVEAVEEDGEIHIRWDDRWFRTLDDFFQKAELEAVVEEMLQNGGIRLQWHMK